MVEYIWGTGRRKTSVARVRIAPGEGKIIVNGRPVEEYFQRPTHVVHAIQPLVTVGREKSLDVYVNVRGGGQTGQAGAIRHALARALVAMEPNLRPTLKTYGFLTRDPRMVERKKPGQPGARKRFQFSKR